MLSPGGAGLAPLLLLLVSLHLLWTVTGPGTPDERNVIGNISFLVIFGLSATITWQTAGQHKGRLRKAWQLVTAGIVAWTLGQAIYTYLDLFTNHDTFPSFADIGYLLLSPFLVLGVVRAVRPPSVRWQMLTFVLDATMILVAMAGMYWHTFVARIVDQHEGNALALMIALAYPLTDLLLFATVLTGILWQPRVVATPTHTLFALGVACYLTVNVIYQNQASLNAYHIGSPLDSLWMWSAALLALAAHVSTHPTWNTSTTWRTLGVAWARTTPIVLFALPYLGMLLAFLLSVTHESVHESHGEHQREKFGVNVVTVAIVGLALVRLFFSQVMTALLQRQLDRQAKYDPLTGLANREHCTDVLTGALRRTREGTHLVAVMFVDLDRFKTINDTFGHTTGDLVLRQAVQRIQSCVRDADTVARFGGDEFIVILDGLTDVTQVAAVAQRILQHLAQPFTIGAHTLGLTTSIGVTICPTDAQDEETAVRYAGLAMYQAKRSSKNTFRFFNEDLQRQASEQFYLETELQSAIERGEFELNYQPLRDLRTNELHGFEALLRWNSPVLGRVPPDRFIPVAEERGSIIDIGAWVLNEAARQVREWRDHGFEVHVSVNVSAVQFAQPDFTAMVKQTLDRHDLPGQAVKLELTESTLIQDIDSSNEKLRQLKELGVRVSLDDFGTGYSSLACLRMLNVDALKIDRSFVWDMEDNGTAFVETIVRLAHHLGLITVAEGIETPAQIQQLSQLKCDIGQGYFLARPLSAPDARAYLERGSPHAILH